jgi:hypothetical protein
MYKQQRKKRNIQEKFRRRKISLVSKVDDLHRFFGADIFLVIRKRGRYSAYISSDELHWPPTKEQIVSLFYYRVEIVTDKLSETELPPTRDEDPSRL